MSLHEQHGTGMDLAESRRQALALDALSRIARDFAIDQNVHELIGQIALTLSGQFSVTNTFVKITREKGGLASLPYAGLGQYRLHPMLMSLTLSAAEGSMLLEAGEPVRVESLDLAGDMAQFGLALHASQVKVVAPIADRHGLLGIVGLGARITGKALTEDDMKLLGELLRTLSPLVANCSQFSQIRAVNTWFEEILNNFGQACLVADRSDRVIKINAPCWRMVSSANPALALDDVLHSSRIAEILPETIFRGWADFIASCRAAGRDLGPKTLPARLPKNQRLYSIRVATILSVDREDKDLVITMDDITDQRKRERDMYELQKLADTGTMVASISHELNNFVAVVSGGIEIAQIAESQGNRDRARTYLERAKDALSKMRRFTAGLTDFGKRSGEMRPTNLNSLIEEILTFVKVQKRFSDIEITTELDPRVGKRQMSSDQVSQLLLNLLNNASDAIAESGRSGGSIRIETVAANDAVELVITDDGVGIAPDVKERLFRTPLTTKPKGHGFGLTTCAHILKEHNATVEIHSEVGHGTSFHFRFPTVATDEDFSDTLPAIIIDSQAGKSS